MTDWLFQPIDVFGIERASTQQRFFDTNLLRDSVTGKQLTVDQRRAFIAANIRFPQTLTATSNVARQFGVANSNFSRRLDPALKIPESYQLNAGVERDLGHEYAVEANFSFTRALLASFQRTWIRLSALARIS